MTLKIAILGCGPSGLLAAHACFLNDVEFDIFSKKRKSELYGSQYLHNPIPGLTSVDDLGVPVKYITLGTPEEYRRKVHGKWWDGHVAPEEFEPDHTAWDIRQHYDRLWHMYNRKITNYDILDQASRYSSAPDMAVSYDLQNDRDLNIGRGQSGDPHANQYDLVISTVPRTIWKREGDEFIFSEGWALGDAPERGLFVEDELLGMEDAGVQAGLFSSSNRGGIPDNHIICDGTTESSWTRLSRVFGYTSVEWPHHVPQPHPLASMVRKPLHYTPGASQAGKPNTKWLHVGRYGQWRKGYVVTDAFDEVENAIHNLIATRSE